VPHRDVPQTGSSPMSANWLLAQAPGFGVGADAVAGGAAGGVGSGEVNEKRSAMWAGLATSRRV
jgi:hypothetical protein